MLTLIADRRLWLTADKAHVVEDGSKHAAFLLAAPGQVVDPVLVKRLGLEADGEDRIVGPMYEPPKRSRPEPEPRRAPRAPEPEPDGKTIRFGGSDDTPLPADFPVRDLLSGAGLETVEAVTDASDDELLAIKGIGAAKLGDIRAHLP